MKNTEKDALEFIIEFGASLYLSIPFRMVSAFFLHHDVNRRR